MVPQTNMPNYGWLSDNKLNPQKIKRKMDVLGFPYSSDEITALGEKTEMDAIVAYMQKLGSDIPWRKAVATSIVGDLVNPYTDVSHEEMEAWEPIYSDNCAACHGEHLEGEIGPEIDGASLEENELFEIIYNGIPDGGMPPYSNLGADKVWKLVNFVKYYNKGEDH